ncbi:MAG: hypothetical protein E7510_07035 [Ruminococcus sp.]|nr:hypothetical protein [Ruminococcus sp.]
MSVYTPVSDIPFFGVRYNWLYLCAIVSITETALFIPIPSIHLIILHIINNIFILFIVSYNMRFVNKLLCFIDFSVYKK